MHNFGAAPMDPIDGQTQGVGLWRFSVTSNVRDKLIGHYNHAVFEEPRLGFELKTERVAWFVYEAAAGQSTYKRAVRFTLVNGID